MVRAGMSTAAASLRVLVTGASGLLGRAVMQEFKENPFFRDTTVFGTAFSRAEGSLLRADLTNPEEIDRLMDEVRPQVVIHAAAERRPDDVERNPEAAEQLNVLAPWHLGRAAARLGAWLLVVSTDYVFDGSSPPYSEDACPRPLNAYGKLKLRGEFAARAASESTTVLRLPVLFGPTRNLGESAVTALVAAVRDSQPRTIDHWAVRFPAYTKDVARAIASLAERVLADDGPRDSVQTASSRVLSIGLHGILHFAAGVSVTKFEQARILANLLGVSAEHLSPDASPPAGAPRPRDCQLASGRWDAIGLPDAVQATPLRDALRETLVAAGEDVPEEERTP